jgi:hypothetical protein
MSILKRPGWNNYEVLEEGRLHNDKLKERIGKMFDRLSLGYSPNHVVDKISNIIRYEKGDKMDISKVSDDYIMSIATSDSVTRGKFTPSLKSTYQSTNAVDPTYREPEESAPVSMNFTATSTQPSAPVASVPSAPVQEDSEDESDDEEDSEEVETCGCQNKKSVFNPEIAKKNLEREQHPDKSPIKKESVKLSSKAVNQLLKENFIKKKQHQFRYEEKYRMY